MVPRLHMVLYVAAYWLSLGRPLNISDRASMRYIFVRITICKKTVSRSRWRYIYSVLHLIFTYKLLASGKRSTHRFDLCNKYASPSPHDAAPACRPTPLKIILGLFKNLNINYILVSSESTQSSSEQRLSFS